jgi:hypothetical protein
LAAARLTYDADKELVVITKYILPNKFDSVIMNALFMQIEIVY